MRGEFIPQHLGSKLKGEPDMLARRKPSYGSAVFGGGLGEENQLITGQCFEPLPQFPLQTSGAAGAPALKGVGGQDAFFHERPITHRQKSFSDNPRQLRTQRYSGETKMIAGYGAGSLTRKLAIGFDFI